MATTQKAFLKFVVVGEPSSGKTSLVQQFKDGKVTGGRKPTMEADLASKDLTIDGRQVTIQLWDTAPGQLEALPRSFYRGAHGAVIVADRTSPQAVAGIEKWKKRVHENVAAKYPVAIAGNKSDAASDIKLSDADGTAAAAKGTAATFYAVSALSGEGVAAMFETLAREALKHVGGSDSDQMADKIVLSGKKDAGKKKCC